MSTYDLAKTVQGKLLHEVSKKSHNLRRLCGHANLYDALLQDLSDLKERSKAQDEADYEEEEDTISIEPPTDMMVTEVGPEHEDQDEEDMDLDTESDDDVDEEAIDDGDCADDLAAYAQRPRSPCMSMKCNADMISTMAMLEPDIGEEDEGDPWTDWEDQYAKYHADFMNAVVSVMKSKPQPNGHDAPTNMIQPEKALSSEHKIIRRPRLDACRTVRR